MYLDAIIIGAGFSGLYQLHQCRDQIGLKTLIIEEGKEVGGTWYWNKYPGSRCDTESHIYCYTFSKEIYKNWKWKERYSKYISESFLCISEFDNDILSSFCCSFL